MATSASRVHTGRAGTLRQGVERFAGDEIAVSCELATDGGEEEFFVHRVDRQCAIRRFLRNQRAYRHSYTALSSAGKRATVAIIGKNNDIVSCSVGWPG